jgi:glycosyltransferase involved in cell wall biosynthesis
MKAAIYNPYLDTLGGGERYTMAFCTALISNSYKVDVQWKDSSIKEKLENRFGIDLSAVKFIPNVNRGDGYDVCFWVSDGSVPLLRARRNFLHFQIPFKNVKGNSLLNKMKFYRVDKIICNSYFTKKVIDAEYGIESTVIYPPVDVEKIKPKRKENMILSVGRFSQLAQAKRQDILIEAFKRFYKAGFTDWKMILAGGSEVGASSFVRKLKIKSRRYPVKIIENPSYEELKKLYGVAKVFWSASGFGVDEKSNPKGVEHFGIALVEAMAAGCGSLAFDAGGHKEIIAEGFNGYLWRKKGDLVKKTAKLIREPKLLRKISRTGIESSKVYEYERFEEEVTTILL